MKHCIRCGAGNDDTARFCTNCGAPLSSSSAENEQSQCNYQNAYQYRPNRSYSFEASIPTYYRTFQSAVHTCLVEKYATFSGRATRSEYWYFNLFNFLICFGLVFFGIIMTCIFNSELPTIVLLMLYVFYALAIFIPGIAVSVRRLHDKGNSGWFMLLSLIPYIGTIVLFILFILDSEHFDNKYGLAPYEQR